MKTHMVTGPNISGGRLYGEVTPDSREVVRLSGPQFSRGENYYTDYSSTPQELVRHLENNKQRLKIQNLMMQCEGISRQELLDADFDPEIVDSFYPDKEIES
jgi:hypothetical protein